MNPCIFLLTLEQTIETPLFSFLLSMVREEKRQRILAQAIRQNADTMLAGEILAMYGIRECFGIPMKIQQFECGKNGKPFLSGNRNIHFNISHSKNIIAAAVCDQPVGIDVQHIVPWRPGMAKRICSPKQWQLLQKSSAPAEEFTKLWTQKEAIVKRTGTGLAGIRECQEADAASCATMRGTDYYLSVSWEKHK